LGRLVVLLFFIKYGLTVLAETAEGRLQPPPLSSDLFMQGYAMPFKLFGMYLILGAIQYALASTLGVWAGSAFGLLINLLAPAMSMVLAISGSLMAALSPATVFALIWRIGWPYLALLAFVSLLWGVVAGTLMLVETLPLEAVLTLLVCSVMYVS